MGNEIQTTDSLTLHHMAKDLKADARTMHAAGNRAEALLLFRLFRKITEELHRRHNRLTCHHWN